MIPKTIHYVWFGKGPKSELVLRCMDTWKTHLPDYEIIEWNEDTYPVHANRYVSEAIRQRKWAFVSDYIRLDVLHTHGGIYMDTDVEVTRPLDDLLGHGAFTGFEKHGETYSPVTAVMGAQAQHPWIADLRAEYDDLDFTPDGVTNTVRITRNLTGKHGVRTDNSKQTFDDVTIYPADVLCVRSASGYAVHHFNGSWIPRHRKLRKRVVSAIRQLLRTLTPGGRHER